MHLLRSGVRKLIDAVAGADEDSGRRLDDGLCSDYTRPSEKPDCRWREKAERERMLTRVACDAERALRAVEAADGLLEEDAVSEAHRLLRELIGQDFDVDSDGVPRLHRGTRSDRILSVHDPEMRHGRKSQRQRFDGFKLHAAATGSEEPLLTAVDVTPANEADGAQAAALVDSQPEGRRPERLLGDTAYGDSATREAMEAREVDVLAPVPSSHHGERLRKRDFEIDLDAGTVTCPAAEVARIAARPQRNGKRSVVFRKSVCEACPLKPRCCPTGSHRQLVIERREDLLLAARRALDDERAAEHLRRTRPRIERLLGLLAHRYGARKAPYLGAAKARLQALWTAALVNLNPIGRKLAAEIA